MIVLTSAAVSTGLTMPAMSLMQMESAPMDFMSLASLPNASSECTGESVNEKAS